MKKFLNKKSQQKKWKTTCFVIIIMQKNLVFFCFLRKNAEFSLENQKKKMENFSNKNNNWKKSFFSKEQKFHKTTKTT